jgi:hypothetical protein
MKISKSDLYKIVLEEYIKEENLDEAMSREKVDALLRQIRGEDPAPSDDETKFIRTYGKPASDSPTNPMDKPLKPDTASQPIGSRVTQALSVENKVMSLIKDMSKAEVANLFNTVYEKIKEKPGTMPDYGGLAEDKSNNSAVAWEELKDIIREALAESV